MTVPRHKLQYRDIELFEVYYRTRNLSETARQAGARFEAVFRHAKAYRWQIRAEDRDRRISENLEADLVTKMKEDTFRHYSLLNRAANQVDRSLKQHEPRIDQPEDAVRPMGSEDLYFYTSTMEKIIKSQKLLVGEPTEKVEFSLKDFVATMHMAIGEKGVGLAVRLAQAGKGSVGESRRGEELSSQDPGGSKILPH